MISLFVRFRFSSEVMYRPHTDTLYCNLRTLVCHLFKEGRAAVQKQVLGTPLLMFPVADLLLLQ